MEVAKKKFWQQKGIKPLSNNALFKNQNLFTSKSHHDINPKSRIQSKAIDACLSEGFTQGKHRRKSV